MLYRRTRILPLVAVVLLAQLSAAAAQTRPAGTTASDTFVDSVGINIHLHYRNTPYWDKFPEIKSRLLELGIRHVRDGLVDTTWKPYYERHNELGEAGIKGTFITAPDQTEALWASYPSRMIHTFEAYEAPNEMDLLGRRPDWVPVLIETLKRLRTLKSDPRASKFPLYGPSLGRPQGFTQLGDVSQYYDYANLHNYLGGRHPSTRGWGSNGHGSLTWHLGIAEKYARAKPIVTTETGYQDSPSIENSVPPEVSGRYFPILLLEQFRAGIVRTFLYELCDFPKSGSYGLLNQDLTPKPGFTAVKSLLNLLADPGPVFAPSELQYAAKSDGVSEVRHASFQKRDGTYFVALWLTKPSYNPSTRKTMAVAMQRVNVTFPSTVRPVRTHEWQLDGALSTRPAAAESSITVNVADRLVVLELAPAARSGGASGGAR